jgi:hypothetical protein
MKKILLIVTPILLLIVSCAIIAGLVHAHWKSTDPKTSASKKGPSVEYMIFTYSGGITGHYDLEERVYQSSSGYHLYRRYEGDENTFDLTETEYRICTDVTPEYLTELEQAEPQRGSDLIYTTITVKFKGKDEITLPPKAYNVIPFTQIKYILDVKMNSYESLEHYELSKRLGEFLLEHESYFTTVNYSFRDPDSKKIGKGSYRFFRHAYIPTDLQKSREYTDLVHFCSRMELNDTNKDEFTMFMHDGQEAYYASKYESNMIAFVIVFPDKEETFRFISSVPNDMTEAKCEKALIKTLASD